MYFTGICVYFTSNLWYSNHLNTGLVGHSNGRFVSGCQLVLYMNGVLETRLKSLFMVQYVRYLNGTIWIPDTHNLASSIPFEYRTNLSYKVSIIQMPFEIQPTWQLCTLVLFLDWTSPVFRCSLYWSLLAVDETDHGSKSMEGVVYIDRVPYFHY